MNDFCVLSGVPSPEKSGTRYRYIIRHEGPEKGHLKSPRPHPHQNGEKHPGRCGSPLHRQVTLRFSNRGKIVPNPRFLARRRSFYQTVQRDHVYRGRCQILPGGIGLGLGPFTPFGNYLQRFETGKVSSMKMDFSKKYLVKSFSSLSVFCWIRTDISQ